MFYNFFTENRRNSNREIIKDSAEGSKTDSQTPPSINVQSDGYVEGVVNVILPLKLYELTIQHRVLAELGELSHFILSVMDKYDLTLKNIEEVTGLTEVQIRPVVDRLKALKFIEDAENNLTEKGKRTAYILGNIHGKQISLYIDQNYASYNHDWFISLENNSSLKEISESSFVVPLPKSIRFNPIEDCFNQSQRFQKNYTEILPKIIPEFNHVTDESDNNWYQEWDLTIRTKACGKDLGIPIELELKKSSNELEGKCNEKNLRLYTELVRLNIKFSLPTGINFGEYENIDSMSFIYSENDQKIYDSMRFEIDPDEDKRLCSEGLYNEQEIALNLLAHSVPKIDDDAQLYSRENCFDKVWQLHEYTFEEVSSFVTEPEFIRIRG